MVDNKKWLIYASYEKNGREILVDYTLIASSRVKAKLRAMERMVLAGGEKRHIDEIHLIDAEFKRKEAEMVEH